MSFGAFIGKGWIRARDRVTKFLTYVGGAMTIYTGYQIYRANFEESYMHPNAILYLNLNKYAMSDGAPNKLDFLQSLIRGRDLKNIQDVIDSLRMAKDDPRIYGLVANLSQLRALSLPYAQELSEAIKEFTGDGRKFSIAYSDSFGELEQMISFVARERSSDYHLMTRHRIPGSLLSRHFL
jgi:hypothetical protein